MYVFIYAFLSKKEVYRQKEYFENPSNLPINFIRTLKLRPIPIEYPNTFRQFRLNFRKAYVCSQAPIT